MQLITSDTESARTPGQIVLRINGAVIDATEFAYDGCHKVYLIFSAADREAMLAAGYTEPGDILPVSRLPEVWESTCFLRFISRADLTSVLVEQADPEPTISYTWEPLAGGDR
jgi:hypothetical protein